jgi:hypothetical protein
MVSPLLVDGDGLAHAAAVLICAVVGVVVAEKLQGVAGLSVEG